MGFARPLPARSGALPWTASNSATLVPMFAPGTRPRPPTSPAHRSLITSPNRFLHHQHVKPARVERQQQAQVVDLDLVELQERKIVGHLAGGVQEQAVAQGQHVGFVAKRDPTPPAVAGQLEGEADDAPRTPCG